MLFACSRRASRLAALFVGIGCGTSSPALSPGENTPTGGAGGGAPDARVGSDATGGATSDAAPSTAPADGEAVGDAPSEGGPVDCHPLVEAHPIEGFNHVPTCDPVSYLTNPPSSGNHYPYWAAYGTYTKTFRPGFWVHNLEHGAVVIGYNCPAGCAEDVAAAQGFIDSLPNDCVAPPRRIIFLPNPELDKKFAASAWGFTLKADCFDRPSFAQFVADHYGHGREAVCGDGLDPTGGPTGPALCP
jgi:hypothetical protein